jgi:hypothetical protein
MKKIELNIRDETTILNYEIASTSLSFTTEQIVLNCGIASTSLSFATDQTVLLNFELNCYDQSYLIYKILLDWIESFTVGDIF